MKKIAFKDIVYGAVIIALGVLLVKSKCSPVSEPSFPPEVGYNEDSTQASVGEINVEYPRWWDAVFSTDRHESYEELTEDMDFLTSDERPEEVVDVVILEPGKKYRFSCGQEIQDSTIALTKCDDGMYLLEVKEKPVKLQLISTSLGRTVAKTDSGRIVDLQALTFPEKKKADWFKVYVGVGMAYTEENGDGWNVELGMDVVSFEMFNRDVTVLGFNVDKYRANLTALRIEF